MFWFNFLFFFLLSEEGKWNSRSGVAGIVLNTSMSVSSLLVSQTNFASTTNKARLVVEDNSLVKKYPVKESLF